MIENLKFPKNLIHSKTTKQGLSFFIIVPYFFHKPQNKTTRLKNGYSFSLIFQQKSPPSFQALEAILTSGELSGEAWAAAYNSIKAIPAIDAAPVIHAPVSHRSIEDYEGTWQTCGKCHYENNAEDALFCGGCGAKLDGEYSEP